MLPGNEIQVVLSLPVGVLHCHFCEVLGEAGFALIALIGAGDYGRQYLLMLRSHYANSNIGKVLWINNFGSNRDGHSIDRESHGYHPVLRGVLASIVQYLVPWS
ncbi:MAG: hypothetical protein QG657_5251 [Acidobacteriota bacterium]|nr:hypothetical protein [Acidobacteriota bacterium]